MQQLNSSLPDTQEEIQLAAVTIPQRMESPLLSKMRQKFEITSIVSLLFGSLFAFSFYKTYVGLNVLFFTMVMVTLLFFVMKKFEILLKTGTKVYYTGAILFGLSTMLSESETLHFLNILAILFLLNLSILNQFHDGQRWDFLKYIAKMFGMVLLSIAAIGMPFVDGANYLKRTKVFKNDKVRNVFVGIVISLPILWIIIALLSGADMIFGDMTKGLFDLLFSADIIAVAFLVLFGFLSCYCILCGAATQVGRENEKPYKKADASIAVTIMTLLCLIYALFCGLQMVYLFANGLFALPEGYTFAEYARQGFFELLAVTIINVLIMLLCTTLFAESKLLRILLTFMTACTYILIASATYRMLLYIGSYRLTFLRLFVLLSLLIIGIILTGVIISVYQRTFPLFRYSVAVIAICYLSFSFARPDYWIASYLSEQKNILTAEDAKYLAQDLSLDAAPVVLPLFADDNRWSDESKQVEEEDGIYYEDEYGSHIILRALEYYKINYYDYINNQEQERAIRDYNVSCDTASKYVEQYPIHSSK